MIRREHRRYGAEVRHAHAPAEKTARIGRDLFPKERPESHRRQHLHPAAIAKIEGDAEAGRGHLMLAGEVGEELVEVGRVAGHHRRGGNIQRAIGVALVFGPPEVLRIMMLAGEEPCPPQARIAGECQGEGDLALSPVRPLGDALEAEGLIDAEIVLSEIGTVASCVVWTS